MRPRKPACSSQPCGDTGVDSGLRLQRVLLPRRHLGVAHTRDWSNRLGGRILAYKPTPETLVSEGCKNSPESQVCSKNYFIKHSERKVTHSEAKLSKEKDKVWI